jgi:hypothetical protein
MAVRHAIADKRPQAYGWVQQLLPDGDDALADVSSACGDLVVKLRALAIDTTAIEAALKTVAIHDAQIQQQFGLINNAAAQIKAVNDMAYVQRTINIITKEMNITSISPVAIFDAARIGPNSVGPYRGTRYAVGGGVRFTLVSTVSVTAGYAFNLHRRPGEGAGAFFFTLTTRNLFE